MNVEERYKGCQTFLTEGCLFLALCSIAEQMSGRKVDILDVLVYAKKQGYITSANELTVDGQTLLLRDLTGRQWRREVMKELPYVVPDAMYTVEKWLNSRTGFTHYRRRCWDTLVNSTTVKEGALVAYYAYVWS